MDCELYVHFLGVLVREVTFIKSIGLLLVMMSRFISHHNRKQDFVVSFSLSSVDKLFVLTYLLDNSYQFPMIRVGPLILQKHLSILSIKYFVLLYYIYLIVKPPWWVRKLHCRQKCIHLHPSDKQLLRRQIRLFMIQIVPISSDHIG